MLWRAWILWPRKRTNQVISGVLLLGTLGKHLNNQYGTLRPENVAQATGAVNNHMTCKMQPIDLTAGSPFMNSRAGILTFVLSWLTNLWATGLITFKAWYALAVTALLILIEFTI